MALINCEECNEEISSLALACPKCGYKIKKEKNKFLTWIKRIVITIVLLVLIFLSYTFYSVTIGEPIKVNNISATPSLFGDAQVKVWLENKGNGTKITYNLRFVDADEDKKHCQGSTYLIGHEKRLLKFKCRELDSYEGHFTFHWDTL